MNISITSGLFYFNLPKMINKIHAMIKYILILLIAASVQKCTTEDENPKPGEIVDSNIVSPTYGKTKIADLVLIYQGGGHRPMEWTKDQFLPYVVHEDQQGNKNWLFDGFLFLEFKDGKGHNYAPGYDKLNARCPEWEWLLDRRFAKDKAFSSLNQCIAEQKAAIGNPGFKHKMISGIPSPILNQDDWGEINGTKPGSMNGKKSIKPIEGSWFEFQHHNAAEGKYWNPTLEKFTSQQWEAKVKEIAGCGIRYLVLLDVAIYGKSYYPSELLPQHQMGCDDPLETILSAADKYGIRFFVSNGFFGEWRNPVFLMKDPGVNKLRRL